MTASSAPARTDARCRRHRRGATNVTYAATEAQANAAIASANSHKSTATAHYAAADGWQTIAEDHHDSFVTNYAVYRISNPPDTVCDLRLAAGNAAYDDGVEYMEDGDTFWTQGNSKLGQAIMAKNMMQYATAVSLANEAKYLFIDASGEYRHAWDNDPVWGATGEFDEAVYWFDFAQERLDEID